jgi:7,8-dihydropterin-6-yl-methyl-4-(beta-D-ribofuranosyl)aminobenzene 5'-phosphate synthase
MIQRLSITALVENTAGRVDCLGEWGLALWIEADEQRILYDTGQGRTLLDNARLLGIHLKDADALVVSHGHHDHTGGIATVMASEFRGKVYAHPAVLAKRYQWEENSPPKSRGIPAASEQALRSAGSRFIASSAPTELAPGLLVSGAIPRRTEFEDTGVKHFLDEACTQPDPIVDDQALFIETNRGWVIVTGCGHSGAVNTLTYAREITGSRRIHAVVGGMHLLNASAERLRATTEGFKDFRVNVVVPCHCTGFHATGLFQSQFGADALPLRAGLKLQLAE